MASNEFTQTCKFPQWALHVASVRAGLDQLIYDRLIDALSVGDASLLACGADGWTVAPTLDLAADCRELDVNVGAGIVTINTPGQNGALDEFVLQLTRHAIAYDITLVEHAEDGNRLRETQRVRYDHRHTKTVQRILGENASQRPTLAQILDWATAGDTAAIVESISAYNASMAPTAPLLTVDETDDLPLTIFLATLHDGVVAGATDESPAGPADLARLAGRPRESFLASLAHGFARNREVLAECLPRGFQPVLADCGLLPSIQHPGVPDLLQAMHALLARQAMDRAVAPAAVMPAAHLPDRSGPPAALKPEGKHVKQ